MTIRVSRSNLLLLVTLLLFCTVCIAQAQPSTLSACHYTTYNLQGSSGADITVSTAAVLVLAGYAYNCQAIIFNNSANSMRCGGSNVTASANGQVVPGNASLSLDYEAQQNWYCIRTDGGDAVANVTERRTQ